MMFDYSEAEQTLIKTISEHWFDVIHKTDINPPNLYRIMAEEAFVDNRRGPAIEALRRVCKALRDSKIYRCTPEFDKLCEIQQEEIYQDDEVIGLDEEKIKFEVLSKEEHKALAARFRSLEHFQGKNILFTFIVRNDMLRNFYDFFMDIRLPEWISSSNKYPQKAKSNHE
jgi:hypothetical protein